MKKLITIVFLIFCFNCKSQVFTGTGGPIQNNGVETYYDLPVSGLTATQLDNFFGIEEVCINIVHPAVEELYIYLESPAGIRVELAQGNSCKGVNYAGTCFNNTSPTITLATAPYSGDYKPIGYLGRLNNGGNANGTWRLIVKDYLAFVNSGTLVQWSIQLGNSPPSAIAFTSSDLPIVVINTNNQVIADTKILTNMGIIYNGAGQRNYLTDPMNNYNGNARISLRGNSSKYFEKKPYSIETCDAAGADFLASLLEMPMESEWNLIGMYQDKSLMRIPLTYDLARKMGNYAARYKMVEVIINNEYQGVYAFMEKLKRDENRINIPKLSPTENTAPAITGGYIIKIDRTDEPGWTSLHPGDATGNSHFYYQYVYPKHDSITIPQKDYIKSFVDSFENVMNSPGFYADPWVGYQKYIDLASLVDYFILNELSKNVDAYRLSTYLYKKKITSGGKLHIGPVWDYDLAWHNCNYSNSFDPAGWQYQLTDTMHPTPIWWSKFMQDINFTNALYCRWTQLRQNVLSNANLYAYVDSFALALNESQQRNFTQWPILGAYIFPNPQNQANASFQNEVIDLKNWIAGRTIWLDVAITGVCPPIGVNEYILASDVVISPNPFHVSTTFEVHIIKEAHVSLKIIDVLGKEIAMLIDEHTPAGPLKITFDKGQNPAGIYVYQLKINNILKTGKVIIQ